MKEQSTVKNGISWFLQAEGCKQGQCYNVGAYSTDIATCGPYHITEDQWIDCGQPGGASKWINYSITEGYRIFHKSIDNLICGISRTSVICSPLHAAKHLFLLDMLCLLSRKCDKRQ